MGKNRNLDDFAAWKESLPGDVVSTIATRTNAAISEGRFKQSGLTFTSAGGKVTVDYEPFLADPECFGQPKQISAEDAFTYQVVYRGACRKAGVKPGDFVDFRYFVGLDEENDPVVVRARDC